MSFKDLKDAIAKHSAEPTDESKQALTDGLTKYEKELQDLEAANKPPEKYDLKRPDTDYVTDEDLKEFEERARKAGMNNAAAQAILDRIHEARKTQTERLAKAEKDQTVKWGEEVDRRWPGEKKNPLLAKSKQFFDRFGSDALKQFLGTGIGNNPDLIEAAAKAFDEGKFGEDKAGDGNKAGEAKDAEAKKIAEMKKGLGLENLDKL